MTSKRTSTTIAHPHRACAEVCCTQDCLADLRHSRVYHIASFEEGKRNFTKAKYHISDDACICLKCYRNVAHMWKLSLGETKEADEWASTSGDNPAKKKQKKRPDCFLKSVGICDKISAHTTHITDWPMFVACMKLEKFVISAKEYPDLCLHHYNAWHSRDKHKQCNVCKENLKSGGKEYSIPDYTMLMTYFNEIGDAKANLPEDSTVCPRCYRSFKNLTKQLSSVSFSYKTSLDSDLRDILKLYEGYLSNPAVPANIHLHRAIVFCASRLLKHSPFLLSDVFLVYRKSVDQHAVSSEVSTPSYLTPSTLLSKLLACLGEHMRHATIEYEPSLGTLLWRNGDSTADLLLRLLNANKNQRQTQDTETVTLPNVDVKKEEADILQKAASLLRSDVHSLSQSFSGRSRKQDFSTFDLSRVVAEIPPRLWNFFILATESQSHRTIREYSTEPGWMHAGHYIQEPVTDVSLRYKLRILYGICHKVYMHDNRCGYPVHTLLGEVVHSLGGSDELMHILNRFGIVSSLTRVRNHELDYVFMRLQIGWEKMCTRDAFCFVSVDNVDKSSVHASVKAAGGSRGIHATSYQLVEPKPKSCTISSSNTATERDTDTLQDPSDIDLPPFVTVKDINEIRKQKRPRIICWDRLRERRPHGNISDFDIQQDESCAIQEVTSSLIAYGIAKYCQSLTEARLVFPDVNLVCPRPNQNDTEKSNVVYLGVLNEHADNINTIKEVVETLHQEVVSRRSMDSLLVVGDGKTYFHLVKLKQEYSTELDWMIPFPGDWHCLKNFQPVLMKVYWHAGLQDLASCVHKGATLASLQNCSNFRRTHDFLVLVWEAFLRTQIAGFREHLENNQPAPVDIDFVKNVTYKLSTLPTLNAANAPDVVMGIWELIRGAEFEKAFSAFRDMMSVDETYRLWNNFIHRDMLAYLTMFVAMRTGNWSLRMGALKMMAPLFHAFDRPTYLRLVPRHLLDVLQMPQSILQHLKNGGFVASLKGNAGRHVGADECHEMKINKEVKMAMAKPIPEMMERIAILLPYRATTIEQLKNQVAFEEVRSDVANTAELLNMEGKVQLYVEKLKETPLACSVPDENPPPLQTLAGELADNIQREDMKTFYEIGKASLKSFISTRLLGQPSTEAPHRQKRLKTFLPPRKRQKKVSLKSKNRQLVNRCLRKIIVQSKKTAQPISSLGQFIRLPLAISNPKGTMVHGNKANATTVYRRRYSQAFTNTLPVNWSPECVILEGMFLINSAPMRSALVFRDYTYHIMGNFILPRFARGVKEVHVVFDDPGRNGDSAKDLERMRRDEDILHTTQSQAFDSSITILPDTALPDRSRMTWRQAMLSDRVMKRKLVNFLSSDLLHVAQQFLQDGQCLITAGGFDGDMRDKAMVATKYHLSGDENLTSNHEESDSRVWLHCVKTSCTKVLVYSPDTDTYHIGLKVLVGPDCLLRKDAIVQLSMVVDAHEYVIMSSLLDCLVKDPDMDSIPKEELPSVIQSIFIASGCDYTSFFFGCGKASFLSAFFMHAAFISGKEAVGTLADTDVTSAGGLLAFYRLIGSIYFKKFSSVMPHTMKTPRQLFQTYNDSDTALQQHHRWLDCIREYSWEKVDNEEEVMPSNDALSFHWQRCCWVSNLWGQAGNTLVVHGDLIQYGYCLENNKLAIMSDSPGNIEKVDELVENLTKGCKCKTGCSTNRCLCNKKHKKCSAGCSCCNCVNPHATNTCITCDGTQDTLPTVDTHLDDLTIEENETMMNMQPDDAVYESDEDTPLHPDSSAEYPTSGDSDREVDQDLAV